MELQVLVVLLAPPVDPELPVRMVSQGHLDSLVHLERMA